MPPVVPTGRPVRQRTRTGQPLGPKRSTRIRSSLIPDATSRVLAASAKGDDPQLTKAVDVLKGDVTVWQQKRNGNGPTVEGAAPMTAGTNPPTPPGGSK